MIPQCIGIIMDGNRRFARERGLPLFEGHRRGYEKMKEVARFARDRGIGTLIFYAFSTENWQRSEKEIDALMNLLREALRNKLDDLEREDVRVLFIGQRERLSEDIRALIAETEERTKNRAGLTVAIALSYGGRAEIVEAVNNIMHDAPQSVTEEDLARHLWTRGLPDPDILIRTGGEQRLSNFLPWQSVYSELFFTPTLWPAFSPEEFQNILNDFAKRERRHGK